MEKRWGKEEIWINGAPYAVRIPEGQWGRRRGEEGENKLSGGDEMGNSGVTRACLFPLAKKQRERREKIRKEIPSPKKKLFSQGFYRM